MNIIMWIVAGGAMGWASFVYLRFNDNRGMIVSVIIGMAGGLLGGKVIAPMFGAGAAVPGDFSLSVLVVALACAAAFLYIADKIEERFGM
jgi:uncharacterized membrane protein YeaQ/YmgE (transglycosylase-associated protein family)